jgi:glycosyltransferase involved in cell wall biosynthesis
MAAIDRLPLSVCIIAYNEADRIRDCLESVKWAGDVLVVDSLSTDDTPKICRDFGARVIQRPWPGWIAQKNFALDQAKHEWALSLDADERLSPELATEIQDTMKAVASGASDCVGFTMPRRVFYLGRWIRHCGWYPDRKLRLVKKTLAHWAGTDPHDHLYVEGKVGALRGDILHYTYRNLSDHMKTLDRFTTVGAAELLKAGAKSALPQMVCRPPARFLRMYLLKLGFLDGVPGFVASAIGGYYVFMKYAKLWEMFRNRADKQE